MRTLSRHLWILAVLCGFAVTVPDATEAQRQYFVESFNATIQVREDGSIRVIESIRFRFEGSYNGVYRTIPVEYETDRGFKYRLFLNIESITDESGSSLRYEQSKERGYRKFKIYVPNASDVTRTITLRYTIANALRFFEEHDELYWNVTGTEWDVPIQAASALVELPPEATGLRASAFVGQRGSTEQASAIDELESGFYFEPGRGLRFHEGLTIVVGWDSGVVDKPGAVTGLIFFLKANWLLLLPILTFAGMFWLWNDRGKDPSLRPITPQYKPPEGMTAAEAGTLVDNNPDPRDITATIVDLAIRGHLRIEETEKSHLAGLIKVTEYTFVRLTDPEAWYQLPGHELLLLEGLFDEGTSSIVELSDLENEFYKTLAKIKVKIYQELVAGGYYRKRPDKVRAIYITGGVILGAALVFFVQFLADFLMISVVTGTIAAVLTPLPILFFGYHMPARTKRGARKLEEVLGFEEFLNRVEADHFRRMITSPEQFEEGLPYAMALGVEKKWARVFDDIYKEPPQWYVGRHHGVFRPSIFVGDLNSMCQRAGTTMASSPRSSGGSGFGGGSSGGGFGGGGGGAF